ncbi:HNH endonuclease [Geodermatophilus sp. YIM 151500]|uniref:HNH endonuclease signature motif containing protein n=1 Tax=Geodermatophilus sp. YIM 151500 TaxID=2984531 RepID=UPI0021E4152F|nr:HNH endonuclease signature motif containing protein [Geodermatophilus sp. YIM 151500]MCV2488520.1 HNH endonuclease [Geodermatophilus sp. YIM 151500]
MGDLAPVLDALATDDLFAMGAPELLERVRALVAARNRLDAELARTVRRAELAQAPEHDGMTTMPSWLRGHCRLSAAAAGRLVRNGRAAELLPAVAAAHADGSVTADQMALCAPAVTPERLALAADLGVDLGGVDAVFAEVAVAQPHDELAAAVRHYEQRLDEDGPEPDPTEGRTFTLARHPDGRVTGRFDLDPVGGEKVCAVIESTVQAGRSAGDDRTRSQQQGDALVQWADNTLAAGDLPLLRQVRPHVALKVDLASLVDPATGPGAATTGFGATLSAAHARWVACDADITRIVLGPEGQPLDVGRTQRLVTAGIRKAVEHRDGQCIFAGCSAPTCWCEVHHVLAWAFGGETSLDNSALLCERHHTQVHSGFRVERDVAGRWHTYRPDGSEILVLRLPGDDRLPRAG